MGVSVLLLHPRHQSRKGPRRPPSRSARSMEDDHFERFLV